MDECITQCLAYEIIGFWINRRVDDWMTNRHHLMSEACTCPLWSGASLVKAIILGSMVGLVLEVCSRLDERHAVIVTTITY